jgi:hypothetical protein
VLCRELLRLIHAAQLDAAAQKIDCASREQRRLDHLERTLSVAEINRALIAIKGQRNALQAVIKELPEPERSEVEVRLWVPLEEMLDRQWSALRADKRRLSKPSG